MSEFLLVLVEKVLGIENEVGSRVKFKKLYNQLADQNVKTPNKATTGNPQGFTYVMATLHVFIQQILSVVFYEFGLVSSVYVG